jgi:hypothetical protein
MTIQRRATWADAERHLDFPVDDSSVDAPVRRWSRLIPAELSGHALRGIDNTVPNTLAGVRIAQSRYGGRYVTVSLQDNKLVELVVHGASGAEELAQLAERIGESIPTAASCCADGPESLGYVRVLLRVPEWEHHAIGEELRNAGHNSYLSCLLPGFRALALRIRGLALLPADPDVPRASQALIDWLKRYRVEQAAATWEQARAEQTAQAAVATIPPHARKVKFPVSFMFAGSFVTLREGQILTEPGVIRAVEDMDSNALLPLDGTTGPRPLRPGEVRVRRDFFRSVPELGPGTLSLREGQIVNGDRQYVAALRAAGVDVETIDDLMTSPPPATSSARPKRVVSA